MGYHRVSQRKEARRLTFFIYFSLIGEILLAVFALIMFFLPHTIARWASIFFWIAEFPFLATKQIVIIIGDTGTVAYATFGIPLLYLGPFLYLFLAMAFIAFQNLFEATDRDFFGRKRFPKR